MKHAWMSPPFRPWHATRSDLELMEGGIPLGQFASKSTYEIICHALTPDPWSHLNWCHDKFFKKKLFPQIFYWILLIFILIEEMHLFAHSKISWSCGVQYVQNGHFKSPSVSLTDDQRWRSEAGVPFLPVLPQPPEHRVTADLASPRQTPRCWPELWSLWRENSITPVYLKQYFFT